MLKILSKAKKDMTKCRAGENSFLWFLSLSHCSLVHVSMESKFMLKILSKAKKDMTKCRAGENSFLWFLSLSHCSLVHVSKRPLPEVGLNSNSSYRSGCWIQCS